MFPNGFSFIGGGSFPRFYLKMIAVCLQGTIYSNGKRLHLKLKSIRRWPVHQSGDSFEKRESFLFSLWVLFCHFSLRLVVHCRDSLIRTAVYKSFLAPAAQPKAVICLPRRYQTRYLTGEGQMQNGDLPYAVTSLWWGNSSKSLP